MYDRESNIPMLGELCFAYGWKILHGKWAVTRRWHLVHWSSPLWKIAPKLSCNPVISVVIFCPDIWVKSESNRICLSQIWVKKIQKSAYLRHISFRDKSARLFKIWIRKKTIGKEHIFAIRIIPSTPNFQYGRVCLFAMHFMRLQLEEKGISGLSYFKLTLLAKGTDVCQMSVI